MTPDELQDLVAEHLDTPSILDIGLPPDAPPDVVAMFDQAAAAEAAYTARLKRLKTR